jgi:hypothetical protein
MARLTESVVEAAALAWREALGYAVRHGPDIAAGELAAERSDPNYRDVVLEGRLRQALVRLDRGISRWPSGATTARRAQRLRDALARLHRTGR